MRHAVGRCTVIQETSLFGRFPDPGIIISVSVKDDALVIFDRFFDHFMQCLFKIFSLLQTICIDAKTFSDCCVQHNICAGNAVGRTKHPEFKFITSESKR